MLGPLIYFGMEFIMKFEKTFFAALLATSFFFVACGGDSSGASEDFACDVTLTETTVTTYTNVPGMVSYKETGVLHEDYISFVQLYEYASSAEARSACASMSEDAEEWRDGSVQVSCSGNTVTWSDYSETDDLVGYAEEQREQCAELLERYESGTLFDEDDDW